MMYYFFFTPRQTECNFASLDADNDAGGSNGGETITFQRAPTSNYVYTIYVQLYENGNGDLLTETGGVVELYRWEE